MTVFIRLEAIKPQSISRPLILLLTSLKFTGAAAVRMPAQGDFATLDRSNFAPVSAHSGESRVLRNTQNTPLQVQRIESPAHYPNGWAFPTKTWCEGVQHATNETGHDACGSCTDGPAGRFRWVWWREPGASHDPSHSECEHRWPI